jgi:hypothetical protein
MKVTICCLLSFATSALAVAQDFGPQQVISLSAERPLGVYAADLDGDGDLDVLVASSTDNKIAWYMNDGGVFGSEQVITTNANGANSVYATDLDGDGDADVLSASRLDNKIAWYENLGSGSFGPQQVISTSASYARYVYAADLDGDGDADVLSALRDDDMVAWYENLGGGVFGPQQAITTSADGAVCVKATDLDGDGDADVLSASTYDDKIAWYENRLNESTADFGPQQVITTSADWVASVYTADLDGDGDEDVVGSEWTGGKIKWYENQGGGSFGTGLVIATMSGPNEGCATDLDGDGDADVLWVASNEYRVGWSENLGGGSFGPRQMISSLVAFPKQVIAADVDGDGNADVLSISINDDKIAWYENLIIPDCNGNGVPDDQEIAGDPTLDWNGDGILDECLSPNYCTANPNTTGLPAVMSASGSPLVVDNNFTITASQMPKNEWGYFLMAETQGFVPNVGGSGGNLCLGFPFYRFSKPPTGTVLSSGSGGTFSFTPNLTNLPQNVTFMIGETWDFQAWYRDGAASTSNFTDGIEVMFR